MSLSAGLRLGPYEIQAPVGAGGMGEVYKAVDTRLKRIVAIKVLPRDLARSHESRQRLQREARSISQLSHAHICTLYDFGQQDGIDFLVMEYLEGETLEDRVQRGPLSLSQALTYAIQITSALEKAHRVGIVHRDLKPGNIMLTKDGAKLLDFGLAKMHVREKSVVSETQTDLTREQRKLTEKGVILGTFQYMAPEQLEGKEADERTDIFAFGVLLYEMVTGKPPFSGKSRASLVAAILASEPTPIRTLQTMTPPALDHLVRVCLAKDPDERWQRAHDVKIALNGIVEADAQAEHLSSRPDKWRKRLGWAGVAIIVFVAFLMALRYLRRPTATAALVRFAIQGPQEYAGDDPHTVAISPNGRRLVLLAEDAENRSSLWLRPFDSVAAHQLAGTEGSGMPVWSPDSHFLLFISEGKLRKLDTNGGLPEALCDVRDMAVISWDGRNTALFAFSLKGSNAVMPIQQLGLNDCVMKPATKLDRSRYNMGHQWPRFLPDGNHFLYSGLRNDRKNDVLLTSLEADSSQLLIPNASDAKYVSPGYLLFQRNGFLFAQAFDPGTLRLLGEPTQVVSQQLTFASYGGAANYDASENGTLVYQENATSLSTLVVRDSSGTPVKNITQESWLWPMRLAPDRRRLLFGKLNIQTHTSDLWVFDLQRNDWQRLSFEASTGGHIGVWSPDSRAVVYAATHNAAFRLRRKLLDHTSEAELIGNSDLDRVPADWSPDGRSLVFTQIDTNGAGDLWVMPMNDTENSYALTSTQFDERDARFSPDGRWIAYRSDESGKNEVYIRSLSTESKTWQISSGGGQAPKWSNTGNEIYYISRDWKLMDVPITIGPTTIAVGTPRLLFQLPRDSEYEVWTTGRFLVLEQNYTPSPVTAVLNWDVGFSHKQ
jgi:eukaryotic-like serine/threonine-protein kinase